MTEEYQPVTSLHLLPRTSYLIELGKIGDRWALRVFRGKTEIGTTSLTTDLNQNEIFNAVQSSITWMPMFSPQEVFGTIGRLVQEARSKSAGP